METKNTQLKKLKETNMLVIETKSTPEDMQSNGDAATNEFSFFQNDLMCFSPINAKHLYGPQPGKFGALADKSLHMDFWYLEPGQKMVAFMTQRSVQAYVVMQGRGSLRVIEGDKEKVEGLYVPRALDVVVPPSKVSVPEGADVLVRGVTAGDVIILQPLTLHYIQNGEGERMVLLGLTSPEALENKYLAR